jgi:hypothetical protein
VAVPGGRIITRTRLVYLPSGRGSFAGLALPLQKAAFALTIFAAAFLLFDIEPMIGKFLLPWFGGAPSVWTTCIVLFQLLLLAGYGYAHLLGNYCPIRSQARVHVSLLAAGVLVMALLAIRWGTPLIAPASWKPQDPANPLLRITVMLCATVGLPYFILSATAPLLQVWFAKTHSASSPYRLYAVSNLGAMLGLLIYPFAVEPVMTLHRQAWFWFWLFILFAVGIGASAWSLRGIEEPSSPDGERSPGAAVKVSLILQLLWLALAACAALIFLAVTNQLCEEVAAVPLLWVLPLAIYLLSFILCFGHESWYRRAIFNPALAVAIAATCLILYRSYTGLVWQAVIYSTLVACSCTVCHGELVRLKPGPDQLTRFYLMLSAGGAMGGLFGAVVAPWLFRGYWELQLSIWGCAALLTLVLMRDRNSWLHESGPGLALALLTAAVALPELMLWGTGEASTGIRYDLAALGALALAAGVIYRRHPRAALKGARSFVPVCAAALLLMLGSVLLSSISGTSKNNLISVRNFYGAFAVVAQNANDPHWHSYVLRHGHIVHGVQFPEPDKRRQPTAYYGPTSGIGLLMLYHPRRLAADPLRRNLRVGVVGLGVGTIAAYGRPGDYIRFYEIDPAIIHLASAGNGYFTYLRDSRARIDMVAGDARLSMEREVRSGNAQRFDVLVIDAFSGDAIPVHLLTAQAFRVYLSELNSGGVVALHISNNYLDLRPVAARLAQHFGLRSGWMHSLPINRLTNLSDWVILARDDVVIGQPSISRHLKKLQIDPAVALWTDDYSNLFRILRHGG